MTTVSELFDKAYAALDEGTLVKGTYGDGAKLQFCAVGALRYAAFGSAFGSAVRFGGEHSAFDVAAPAYGKAYIRMADRVREMDEASNGYVPNWNDRPERTKADVLALFRQLAAEAAVSELREVR